MGPPASQLNMICLTPPMLIPKSCRRTSPPSLPLPLSHPANVDLIVPLPEDADGGEAHDEVAAAQIHLGSAINLGEEKGEGGGAQLMSEGRRALTAQIISPRPYALHSSPLRPPPHTFAKRMRPSHSGYLSCTSLVAASQVGASRWHQ